MTPGTLTRVLSVGLFLAAMFLIIPPPSDVPEDQVRAYWVCGVGAALIALRALLQPGGFLSRGVAAVLEGGGYFAAAYAVRYVAHSGLAILPSSYTDKPGTIMRSRWARMSGGMSIALRVARSIATATASAVAKQSPLSASKSQ